MSVGPRSERSAWWGVAFFIAAGLALVALDSPGIGWLTLGVGLASLAAMIAIRAGWRSPWRPRPRPRAERPAEVQRDLQAEPAQRRPGPIPPFPGLSPEGEAEVDRLVAVLSRAGILSPKAPEARFLYPAVADRGEPVTVDDVLRCLGEVNYWYPDVDATRYAANLAQHENHVEQWDDYLAAQVADLAELAGGAVPVVVERIRQAFVGDESDVLRNQLDLTVAGRPLHLDYLGVAKYLSTVLHVEIARALRAAGAPLRIAWLWQDDVLLAGLPDQDLDRLNADLALTPADPDGWGGWSWVDESEPLALGEADPSR
ncbi:MAG: hypothetical protein IPJ14_17520 [Kineosporiaceae bacterium]|nr:hypothetical protein [Kineosporiaceae bacterium]